MRHEDALQGRRLGGWSADGVTVLKRSLVSPDKSPRVEIPVGTRVADAIRLRTPELSEEERASLRVVSYERDGEHVLAPEDWRRIKLKPGAFLVITDPPLGGGLRPLLAIVVAVAAMAVAGPLAGALGLSAVLGATAATALVGAGLMFAGNALLNALIPVKNADKKQSPTYALNGLQNVANPDAPIPLPVGLRHRFAPPYAVPPFVTIENGKQYLTAVFCCGYAPMSRFNEKIGPRKLSSFSFVETEYRGFADEGGAVDVSPFTLVRETVIQDGQQVELRNKEEGPEEDEAGPPADPIVMYTRGDTRRWKAILFFPGGLYHTGKKSGDLKTEDVQIRIRQRPSTPDDSAPWTVIEASFNVSRKTMKPFFVEYEHDLGEENRGAYDVEFYRLKNDDTKSNYSTTVQLIAFQSIMPEYPINQPETALAMVAVKIRATNQLQGTLDEYNGEFASLIESLNPETGDYEPMKETGNPADWYRRLKTMPMNAAAVGLDRLADTEIRAWHAHNIDQKLSFSRIYDYEIGHDAAVRDVCQVGRAVPRMTNGLFGVSVDCRKDELTAYPLTPHNTWGFSGRRRYETLPHAFRVRFRDRNNGFADSFRIVKRPDFVGEPSIFDELEPAGITDADQAFVFGYWRWLEIFHRADTYETAMDWECRMLDHGDLGAMSHRVLHSNSAAGRVVAAAGNVVALNEPILMEEGKSYAIKFQRIPEDGEEGPSRFLTRPVQTVAGEHRQVTLAGGGDLPGCDDLFAFGEAGSIDVLGVVQRVEGIENGHGQLTLVDYTPGIFDALDALVIPPYSTRIGESLPDDTRPPPAPVITGFLSSDDVYTEDETVVDAPRRVKVFVEDGLGSPVASRFILRHRLVGAPAWTETDWITLAEGLATLNAYDKGDLIEAQPKARTRLGVDSLIWGALKQHEVGSADRVGPEATSFTALQSAGGGVTLTWSSDDPAAVGRIRYAPGMAGDYEALAPLHDGYLTASPFLSPVPYAPGIYRFGLQLQDESGYLGPPAYTSLTIAAEALPQTPINFAFDLVGGSRRYRAQPADDDEHTARIRFRLGTPAQAFASAANVTSKAAVQGVLAAYMEPTPAAPGVWRGWASGLNKENALSFTPADPIDVTVPGEVGADPIAYADGNLGTVGAALWTRRSGNAGAFKVISGVIHATDATSAIYTLPDLYALNYYIEFDWRAVAGSNSGILLAAKDSSNYVLLRYLATGVWSAVKRVANTNTTVIANTAASVPAAGAIVRAERAGDIVRIKVGGVTIATGALGGDLAALTGSGPSAYYADQRVGLFNQSTIGAFADNVKWGLL